VTALYVLQQPDQQNHADDHVDHYFDDLRDTGHLSDTPQDQPDDADNNENRQKGTNHDNLLCRSNFVDRVGLRSAARAATEVETDDPRPRGAQGAHQH